MKFLNRLVGNIFPIFYRKIYIDRNQTECPSNLPIDLIDLKDFWKDKIQNAENLWELHKTIMICTAVMVSGTIAIVGVFAIFMDNHEM